MVDDQHDDADDVTDADDDFEAAVGNFAPGLLARMGTGALTRGIVAVMPGSYARRKRLRKKAMVPSAAPRIVTEAGSGTSVFEVEVTKDRLATTTPVMPPLHVPPEIPRQTSALK